MRLFPFVAVAVLALAGCDPTTGADASAEPASPTPDPSVEPQALPTNEAETFVRELYTGIFEDGYSPLNETESGIWTPEAWEDIETAWDRDPAAISVDPFCDCQDPTGMSAGDIQVTLSDPNTATAVVQVIASDRRFPVTLQLKRLDDGWVIDDVVGSGGRTFREALAAGEA